MTKKKSGVTAVASELRESLDKLLKESKNNELTSHARRSLEKQIQGFVTDLGKLLNDLDPVARPTELFDPSDPRIVAEFVSLALVAQPRRPLAEIHRFYGSGVYAIYYTGEFPLYRTISKTETPIYVGQAAPNPHAKTTTEQGEKLSARLNEHKKNIGKATTTLLLEDFEARYLVVQSGWETAAEKYLTHLFKPIWNKETKLVYGLGKHGDSSETRANKRSPWDTLHPARTWAGENKLKDAKDAAQIKRELEDHFKKHPVFVDMNSLLQKFIDELKQV